MATFQVNASTDDCYRRLVGSYFSLTDSVIEAGSASSSVFGIGAGMRFDNITIPQGATIGSAHLTLRAKETRAEATVNTRISAEDVDDAVTFADSAATFDTRFANHTTAIVDWDEIPTWTAGEDYDSIDIKAVIQEIVDRVGWASGQAIVIFWEDFAYGSTQANNVRRVGYSYNGSATYAPKLIITSSGGTGFPAVSTQANTDIAPESLTGNGVVTSLGGSTVTQHGHCWATSQNPTIASDTKTTLGTAYQTGHFTSAITDLLPGTTYYFKAYATNTGGTAYGSQVSNTMATAIGRRYWWVEGREFHWFGKDGVEYIAPGIGVNSPDIPWPF